MSEYRGPADTVPTPTPTPTPGRETSEYAVSKNAGTWSTVAVILGAIVTIGSSVLDQVGANSTIGIIVGGVVAIAGVVTKTLVSLGYIKSRTELKRG